MRHDRLAIVVILLLSGLGCATTALPPVEIPAGLAARTGVPLPRRDVQGTQIPPDVRLEDGLTPEEAVAIALWNNPEFQIHIAKLGFARADLVEAGLLRNPVLSLLLPVGPKQFEATLRWPIEVLLERPGRVAAARAARPARGHRRCRPRPHSEWNHARGRLAPDRRDDERARPRSRGRRP
jgi:cobalt-zinc-cadmium efflux system outer membrane protein